MFERHQPMKENSTPVRKTKVIVLSGPSGVGKTTLCNRIVEIRDDIKYSISATSRPKRPGEKHGREYYFYTETDFKKSIALNMFVEYAEVHGHLYGTPKKFLENMLDQRFHVIMDVDVHGARSLMDEYPYPEGLYFFIIPPDIAELERRLRQRNTDPTDEIKNRLATAREELKYRTDYQFVIENRDLEQTLEQILETIDRETVQQDGS